MVSVAGACFFLYIYIYIYISIYIYIYFFFFFVAVAVKYCRICGPTKGYSFPNMAGVAQLTLIDAGRRCSV